jgi:CheY-like chemotaxis protein
MSYIGVLLSQLQEATLSIKSVQKNRDLGSCKVLEQKLHKLHGALEIGMYVKEAKLCHELELLVLVKRKNFYHGALDDTWFEKINRGLDKIRESFSMVEEQKKKRQVVLIDDDEDLIKVLEAEFHVIGFQTKSFYTGKEAREFLLKKENLTDIFLIVLDRVLPDMDGLELLKEYNESVKIRIPVLILSALTQESEILEGLQEGAIDYVTKPFSVFMLMQKALNLLKTKEG